MSFGKTTPILRIFDEKIQAMPWGSQDMTVTDPFGNRLVFTNAISV